MRRDKLSRSNRSNYNRQPNQLTASPRTTPTSNVQWRLSALPHSSMSSSMTGATLRGISNLFVLLCTLNRFEQLVAPLGYRPWCRYGDKNRLVHSSKSGSTLASFELRSLQRRYLQHGTRTLICNQPHLRSSHPNDMPSTVLICYPNLLSQSKYFTRGSLAPSCWEVSALKRILSCDRENLVNLSLLNIYPPR